MSEAAHEEQRRNSGQRKIVILNVANRVFCRVQQVVDRDKYSKDMRTQYHIGTGPREYLRVTISMPDQFDDTLPRAEVTHQWEPQLLLDLAGDADRIIEQKTLQLMQKVFAAAHGVPDDD